MLPCKPSKTSFGHPKSKQKVYVEWIILRHFALRASLAHFTIVFCSVSWPGDKDWNEGLNQMLQSVDCHCLFFTKETATFFKSGLREDFTFSDYQEFVSLWFFVIMLSDVLTIVGSVYKMVIDQKVSSRKGLTPIKINQQILSQYNINTLWRRQVMRKKKIIT